MRGLSSPEFYTQLRNEKHEEKVIRHNAIKRHSDASSQSQDEYVQKRLEEQKKGRS